MRYQLIVLAILGTLCKNADCSGQEFEVSGTLVTTSYGIAGKMSADQFSISVSNCIWEITVIPSDKSVADYQQVTFDGVQMFELNNFASLPKPKATSGEPVAPNKATGCVVEGEVPHFLDASGVGQVWLSFASFCYFAHKNQEMPIEAPWVWGFATEEGQRFTFNQPTSPIKRKAMWENYDEPPHLPTRVVYWENNGSLTNAEYSASGFTNILGMYIPTESILNVYVHEQSTNTTLLCQYAVKVQTFSKLRKPIELLPKVPVMTGVFDHRFNTPDQADSRVYLVQDRFRSKEEAAKLKTKNQSPSEFYLYGSKISKPFVIMVAVILSSVVFLTVLVRKSGNKKQE